MERGWVALAMIVAAAAVCFVIMLIVIAGKARAHDWYTARHDPVTNVGCCGGYDCAAIPSRFVTPVDGGYKLVMNLEESQLVNAFSSAPIDAFIPYDRVQIPDEGKDDAGNLSVYHGCITAVTRSGHTGGVICFFAAPNT